MIKALSNRAWRSVLPIVGLGALGLAGAAAVAKAAPTSTAPGLPPVCPACPVDPAPEALGSATFDGGDTFEIKDFSFGVENPTTIGGATGGAGAGKVKFNEFTIKKMSDSASPSFLKSAVQGQHLREVVIEMRKSGAETTEAVDAFVSFTFHDVMVTKIDWSGPGDEGPEESISFVYGKLGMTAGDQNGETTAGPFSVVDPG